MHAKRKSLADSYGPLPSAKSALGILSGVQQALDASPQRADNPSEAYHDISTASLVNLASQKKDTTKIRELLL